MEGNGEEKVGDLGQLLREKRQQEGLSLEQAEATTKIRRKYIKALEESDFTALPEKVYVKGLLRNYALYLGLDPKEVRDLYESELRRTIEGEKIAGPPAFKSMDIPLAPPSWLTPDLVIGALLIVALLAFGAWAARQYLPHLLPSLVTPVSEVLSTPQASATSPPVLMPTSTPSPTFTPAPPVTPTLTPKVTSTPIIYQGVEVELRIVERTWLRVTVDGEVEFEGVLEKGAQRTWNGDSVALRCGNAGGVEVTVNGEDLGTLGERGQLVEREWTKEE